MIKNKNVRKRKDILPITPTSYLSSKSKKKNGSVMLGHKSIAIIEFGIIIILFIAAIYYRYGLVESDKTLQIVFARYNEQQQKIKNQENELKHLREKIRNSRDNAVHVPMDEDDDNMGTHNKDKDEWNANDENWIEDIQLNDYKSLRLQYGEENPINVLIETNLGNIILEMAPILSMPHTVRYFLNLVENKFWNGCHFFRNANHVIQANCHKRNHNNMNGREDMIGLGKSASIVFQEYDDTLENLHEAYTIGLAGRPGGPDFYINLVDNKRNHGPGGQGPKADPCFANIVSGKEVVDKIHALEHDGTAMMVLKNWVEFKQISVIRS